MARAIIVTLFLFITYVSCSRVNNDRPLVRSPQGSVRGTIRKTRTGRDVSAFLGIPYAEPPVGELRFRNPVPKASWSGVLDAVNDTAICPQLAVANAVNEDCLYLHVYKPRHVHGKKLLPVMVFIHGGSFVEGSNNPETYGPDYLLEKDVILVVPNYRLGIFGFLSNGEESISGNFGLKDQVEALRWVQRNIRAFGGNPNKVTIFGESSGSSCIQLHTLSDASNGLFHQYIMQSGTAITGWAFRNDPPYSGYPKKIAEMYNCPTSSSRAVVSCLKNLRVEQLLNTTDLFNEVSRGAEITWGPSKEPPAPGAFLVDHPVNLFVNNKQKDLPFIAGDVKDEALLFAAALNVSDELYQKTIANLPQNNVELFKTFLSPSEAERVSREVMQYYFNGRVSDNKNVALKQISDFNGETFYLYPQVAMLKHMARTSRNPFYFYSFEYRGSYSITNLVLGNNENIGVSHADDLLYLFPFIPNLTKSETDIQVLNSMVDLWTSFAATGVPKACSTSNPDVWKPYALPNKHLRIGNNAEPTLKMVDTFHEDGIRFWDRVLPYER